MSFTIGDKAYDCKDFRVGQGHHGFDNNWWVGSSECVTIPDSEVYKCKCGAWLPTSEQVTNVVENEVVEHIECAD